jgi:hypothetical protein
MLEMKVRILIIFQDLYFGIQSAMSLIRDEIVNGFNGLIELTTGADGSVTRLKDAILGVFDAMKTGIETKLTEIETSITNLFVGAGGEGGILDTIKTEITTEAQELGAYIIEQVSAGITLAQDTLKNALIAAIDFAFEQAQLHLDTKIITVDVSTVNGASASQVLGSSVTNNTTNNNYNLNVSSTQQSQTIVRDFDQMKTFATAN